MRSIVITQPRAPDTMRTREASELASGEDGAMLEVAFTGTGFVDTLLRAGKFPLPALPTPGIEATGRIPWIDTQAAQDSAK